MPASSDDELEVELSESEVCVVVVESGTEVEESSD